MVASWRAISLSSTSRPVSWAYKIVKTLSMGYQTLSLAYRGGMFCFVFARWVLKKNKKLCFLSPPPPTPGFSAAKYFLTYWGQKKLPLKNPWYALGRYITSLMGASFHLLVWWPTVDVTHFIYYIWQSQFWAFCMIGCLDWVFYNQESSKFMLNRERKLNHFRKFHYRWYQRVIFLFPVIFMHLNIQWA